MPFTVRPEEARDYPAIAEVHLRAFRRGSGESLLVAAHRLRPEFDPELSLVAEGEGAVVGHALFSPRRVIIGGEVITAVNVAPVGVRPEHQRTGVGSALLRRGLEAAAAKGYRLAFLLGRPTYYPRFGFVNGAYGHSRLTVPRAALAAVATDGLTVRDLAPADIPAVQALRREYEAGADFSIQPGDRYAEWVSANPFFQTSVFCRGEEVVGFARYLPGNLDALSCFYARDRAAARGALRLIVGNTPGANVFVPLHPAAPAVRELFAGIAWEPAEDVPAAAQAVSLAPSAFDRYWERLQRKEIPAGRITWPVEFEVLD